MRPCSRRRAPCRSIASRGAISRSASPARSRAGMERPARPFGDRAVDAELPRPHAPPAPDDSRRSAQWLTSSTAADRCGSRTVAARGRKWPLRTEKTQKTQMPASSPAGDGAACDALVAATTENPGAPFAPDVVRDLAALKRANRAQFESLRTRLKKAGCRVTELDGLIAEENGERRDGRPPSQSRHPGRAGRGGRTLPHPRRRRLRRHRGRRTSRDVAGPVAGLSALAEAAFLRGVRRGAERRGGRVGDRRHRGEGAARHAGQGGVRPSRRARRQDLSRPLRCRVARGRGRRDRLAHRRPAGRPVPPLARHAAVAGARERRLGRRPADLLNIREKRGRRRRLHSRDRLRAGLPARRAALIRSWRSAASRAARNQPARRCCAASSIRDIRRLRSLPRDERDLVVAARNQHVLAFDNVSGLRPWLSDALCRIASGAGFGTRELYTDQRGGCVLRRPADHPQWHRGDRRAAGPRRALGLLDLRADRRKNRKSEEEVWASFDAAHASVLGALLDAVATGLKRFPEIRPPDLPRMADFAHWVIACEPALWKDGDFLRAYNANIHGRGRERA